ncbi:Rhodanese-like protein [Rhizopus microsporus ATCC 52813]|uniref:Rhodanese-like protein n=1 Tax=Rhizopus microsporus ATCC 52813 TaxID=1340429 RepID=A0A2G4SRL2_RHIZD|nr:Rhodanese-like protein [Rhizopus microsporus ATCC 52813]PHZ11400.1 Rhodanese-like protein [Rhizopus microsporus ATCC 52813]
MIHNQHNIKDYILLDVREPKEVEAGYIPTAKNVPLTQFTYAWSLSDKDFEDQYGFKKPNKDKRLITYCLKGIRSTSAVEYLSKLGYTNLDNYIGSYADYVEKTKGE